MQCLLIRLKSQKRVEHIAIQLLWATARLLVTLVNPIYLVDEFIFLFLVLLKEMKTLGESKVLSFLFLVLIERMRRWSESKISFCNLSGKKHLLRPSASGVVKFSALGVFVDDKTSGGWFLFYWGLMRLWVWNLRALA